MYNPFSLQGKTVLVTGASSGIGTTVAVECSKMGACVIITGRNEERLERTYAQLDTTFGASHQMLVADLTDEASIISLVEKINGLDGLVNNAGVNRVKPVTFIKQDDLDYVFAHRDKLCSRLHKRVPDPDAPYDGYDESDDTEKKARTILLAKKKQGGSLRSPIIRTGCPKE